MIDIIFQLLIFFILTTKFVPEEKMIATALPTDMGQNSSKVDVKQPRDININIYPLGMTRGGQPSDYQRQWDDFDATGQIAMKATLSVDQKTFEWDGIILGERGGGPDDKVSQNLKTIHEVVSQVLTAREQAGVARKELDPVVINCFSGMPWQFALAAYDAVRAYEAKLNPIPASGLTPEFLANARRVNFSPPRIREYHKRELGNELWEIIHK